LGSDHSIGSPCFISRGNNVQLPIKPHIHTPDYEAADFARKPHRFRSMISMISSMTTRTQTEKIKPTTVRPSNNRRRRTHPRVPSGNNKNAAAITLIQYSLIGVAVALVHQAGLLSAATTSGAALWTSLWSGTSSSSSSDFIILNGSKNVPSPAKDGSKEEGVMAETDGEEMGRTTNAPAGTGEPQTTNTNNNNKRLVCRFVMAETSLPGQNGGSRFGIFALRDIPRQSPVLYGELAIPLPAFNNTSSRTAAFGDEKDEEDATSLTQTGLRFLIQQSNDYAAWSQGLLATGKQQQQQHQAFDAQSVATPSPPVTIGGLAMLANGHPDRFNVALRPRSKVQQQGGAGSMPSAYHTSRLHYYTASRSIQAGEEILVPSFDASAHRPGPSSDDDQAAPPNDPVFLSRPIAWLHEHGTCVDNLEDVPSASGHNGLGAQSTRFLPMGSIIAPVPVIPIARDSIVVQMDDKDDNSHHHKMQQLLLNYCYGHPDSPVLLFPYGPAITMVNHDGVRPNAALRWSPRSSHGSDGGMRNWNASQVLSHDPRQRRPLSTAGGGVPPPPQLLLELVALRDIHPREEVFISFGAGWQAAYHEHLEQQHQPSEQASAPRGDNITAPADTLRNDAAFRHAIGLPDGVFPAAWLTSD
jgi:hypothetical protein